MRLPTNTTDIYEVQCMSDDITFDLAEYDPLANSPEGVVSSGISCV